LLRRIFNVGPFEVSGSNEVINNQMFDYKWVKIRSKGAFLSTSYSFSDIENSWTICLQDNQGPFSTHYNDQAEIYNAGILEKWCSIKEIIKTSTKLIFIPLNSNDS
jgi:penicillin amidase